MNVHFYNSVAAPSISSSARKISSHERPPHLWETLPHPQGLFQELNMPLPDVMKVWHGYIAWISDLLCCHNSVFWMSAIAINSGHLIKGVINEPIAGKPLDDIGSETVVD